MVILQDEPVERSENAACLIQVAFRLTLYFGPTKFLPPINSNLKRPKRNSENTRKMVAGRLAFLNTLMGVRWLQARLLLRQRMASASPQVLLHGRYLCGTRGQSPTKAVGSKPSAIIELENEPDGVDEHLEAIGSPKLDMAPRKSKRLSTIDDPLGSQFLSGISFPEPLQDDNKKPPQVVRLTSTNRDEYDKCGLPVVPALLNRLTIDNTKRNSLYRTCEFDVQIVNKDSPRPESPERRWSAKASNLLMILPSDDDECLDAVDDEEDEEERTKAIKWQKQLLILDELQPKVPLDPEVTIPIKPILKKPQVEPRLEDLEGLPKSKVVVQKFVYPQDLEPDWGVEDIMAASASMPYVPPRKTDRDGNQKKKPNTKPAPNATNNKMKHSTLQAQAGQAPSQPSNERTARRLHSKPSRVSTAKK